MSKAEKIEEIKRIFKKPEPGHIQIFVQTSEAKIFYKSVEANSDLELVAVSEAEAEDIYNSLQIIGK